MGLGEDRCTQSYPGYMNAMGVLVKGDIQNINFDCLFELSGEIEGNYRSSCSI